MPAKVLLHAVRGPLAGAKYRFDEQMLCMIGRSENCMLQLSGDAGEGVSRHHCLLDVRPPQAFLSDLNSRNGTFVNDKNIGVRGKRSAGSDAPSGLRQLADGDQIRVGNNVFSVILVSAAHCCVCGNELPDDDFSGRGRFETRRLICPECLAAGRTLPPAPPSAKTILFQVCAVCGAKVAVSACPNGGSWEENSTAFICADCLAKRPDPGKTFPMPELEARGQSSLLTLSGYRVLKRIGRGGMGAVYLAESEKTLEKAALKILLPEIAVHEQCREDFIREANNLKPLKHPNIVELKDCGYSGGALFLALEYCSEGTLREFMIRLGHPLPVQTALDLAYQILDGLEYAHNVRLEQVSLLDAHVYTVNGLVHRDIKPANIFLTKQDGSLTAKISDFGIAKAFDMAGISGCTRTGDFSGTLGFIPKQQFLNYKYVKPEVDIWAAAATLYFMLTGRPPRDFSDTSRDVMRIFNAPPLPVRDFLPRLSPRLAEVIDSALDDRVQLHFKSADQLKFALRDAQNA